MFGPPSKLADETDSERHEDNLGHEEPDSDEQDLFAYLHDRMRSGSKFAIHAARGVAGALIEMAAAAERGDMGALDRHYNGGMHVIDCLPHLAAEHDDE